MRKSKLEIKKKKEPESQNHALQLLTGLLLFSWTGKEKVLAPDPQNQVLRTKHIYLPQRDRELRGKYWRWGMREKGIRERGEGYFSKPGGKTNDNLWLERRQMC